MVLEKVLGGTINRKKSRSIKHQERIKAKVKSFLESFRTLFPDPKQGEDSIRTMLGERVACTEAEAEAEGNGRDARLNREKGN